MVTDTRPGQAMLSEADARITTLQGTLEHLAGQALSIDEEIAALHQGHTERTHKLKAAQQEAERTRLAWQSSVDYARLAEGRPQYKQAIARVSEAQRSYDSARRTLADLEAEHARQEQEAQGRRQELDALLATIRQEQESTQQELQGAHAARQRVYEELGPAMLKHAHYQLRQVEQRVRATHTEYINAKREEYEAHQAALAALAPWPALRQEIARQVKPDNATTRTIQATLDYLLTLIADARQVEQTPALPSLTGAFGNMGIWARLLIPPDEVRLAWQSSTHELRKRVQLLTELQEQYYTYLERQEKEARR